MKRVDAAGAAPGNLFTNGDPGTSTPATILEEEWHNTVQEEMAVLVEDEGGTLDQTGSNTTQIQEAIGMANLSASILNAQGAPVTISGLIFDKTRVKAARMFYSIDRQTDTQNVNECGELYVMHDAVADDWKIKRRGNFDSGGVDFSIDSSGQVSYESSDITGPNYAGTLRVKDITRTIQ